MILLEEKVASFQEVTELLTEKLEAEQQRHASDLATEKWYVRLHQALDDCQGRKRNVDTRESTLLNKEMESNSLENKGLRKEASDLRQENSWLRQRVQTLETECNLFINCLKRQEQKIEHFCEVISQEEEKWENCQLLLMITRKVEESIIQFLWPGVRSHSCLKSLSSCIEFLEWVLDQLDPIRACRAPFRRDDARQEFAGLSAEVRFGILRRLNALLFHQKFQHLQRAIAEVTNELKCIAHQHLFVAGTSQNIPLKYSDGDTFLNTKDVQAEFPMLEEPFQVLREFAAEQPLQTWVMESRSMLEDK